MAVEQYLNPSTAAACYELQAQMSNENAAGSAVEPVQKIGED